VLADDRRVRGHAEQEDVLEGALVHQMEPGFVAVQERELLGVSGPAEGFGAAVEFVTWGLSFDTLGENAIFDCPGAARSPLRADHLLNVAQFDVVQGAKGFKMGSEVFVESGAGLVGKDGDLGEEAVADSI
jgi:hypothetical protein